MSTGRAQRLRGLQGRGALRRKWRRLRKLHRELGCLALAGVMLAGMARPPVAAYDTVTGGYP